MNNFTFIPPLPHKIEYSEMSDDLIALNLSPSECVEFFWRVRRVHINAQLSVYLKGLEDELPTWDKSISTSLDSANSNCAFGVTMQERWKHEIPCFIYNDDAFLQITGPFFCEENQQDIEFIKQKLAYHLRFYMAVGSVTISSQYIAHTNAIDGMITAKRFPFEIFGKTFYLNLNVPKSFLTPTNFGIIASYSGNAELNFELL